MSSGSKTYCYLRSLPLFFPQGAAYRLGTFQKLRGDVVSLTGLISKAQTASFSFLPVSCAPGTYYSVWVTNSHFHKQSTNEMILCASGIFCVGKCYVLDHLFSDRVDRKMTVAGT